MGPRPHMLLHTQEYSRLINKYGAAFCETGYNGMEPGYGVSWETELKRHGGPYPW